jgi:hypothetical protein
MAMAMFVMSVLTYAGEKVNAALFGYMANKGLILGMAQMTPSGARVVDPVLTSIAQGYSNNEMVASALFPTVMTPTRGGKIITFGKEDFMLYASQRAPVKTPNACLLATLAATTPWWTTALKARSALKSCKKAWPAPASTTLPWQCARCKTSWPCGWKNKPPTLPALLAATPHPTKTPLWPVPHFGAT